MSRGNFAARDYACISTIALIDTEFGGRPANGLVVYVFATTNGEVEIFYLDPITGAERTLKRTEVQAHNLHVIDFRHHVPASRVKFTPAQQPGSVTVEVCGYG